MEKSEYRKLVDSNVPKSKILKNSLSAFIVGGIICTAGEALFYLCEINGLDEQTSATCVCIALIAITGLLTGFGIFDSLAKIGGAGTMVPITGFANAVVSPAVEFQTEGRVTGTAVKMFTIAGPVIVYGCAAASLYGFICYFFLRG